MKGAVNRRGAVRSLVTWSGAAAVWPAISAVRTTNGTRLSLGRPLRIAYVVPGTLGDKGFLDQGALGCERAKAELGAAVQIVQGNGRDPQEWRRNMQALSGGGHDLVMSGGSGPVLQVVRTVAALNPSQRYLHFAGTVDAPNVASIGFRYDQGSFLAGVLAADVAARSGTYPRSRGRRTIGVIGGMDIPGINAFLAGYEQGARWHDPEIRVLRSYVGAFTDPSKGFAQARAMYAQGADVVYAVAGGSGLGVLRAASTAARYAIGVDTNQNPLYPGAVLASMVLEIANAIVESFQDHANGRLQFGSVRAFGVADAGVHLLTADEWVDAATLLAVQRARQAITRGSIVVSPRLESRGSS